MISIKVFEGKSYPYEVGQRVEVLYNGMGYIEKIKEFKNIPVYTVEMDNKTKINVNEYMIQTL